MGSSTKYVALAIVLAAGLYCMRLDPMDGALVFAAIAAACIIMERLVLSSEENCSCEYSPDHGSVYENFDAKTETPKSHPSLAEVLKTGETQVVAGIAAPSTPEMDSFGKRTDGELGYSQVPIDALKNASERIELKPRSRYGEVFVDPEAWHPPCLRAPVCVTSNSCPVQPVYTNGTYIDLLEWEDSRRITPPSAVDSEYMVKVLGVDK
jgi:hypothetical protein